MKSVNLSNSLSKVPNMKFLHIEILRLLSISLALLVLISTIISPKNVSAINNSSNRSLIVVTTFEDEYNSGPDCSLREAITAANTDSPFGGCPGGSGDDTIQLSQGTYTLSIGGNKEDKNQTGDLDIHQNLTIVGVGSNETIIDGGDLDRVFDVHNSTTTAHFELLRITNGRAPHGSANSNGENGGGIRSQGNLVLDNIFINSNYAGDGGDGYLPGDGGRGGGIYCSEGLTINQSNIQYNYAGKGGSLTTLGDAGEGGDGGGILALGSTSIVNSFVRYNRAGNGGDGILGQQSYATNAGNGGGIAAYGTTTIENTEIRGNDGGNVGAGPGGAGGSGGGIFNAGSLIIYKSTIHVNFPGNGKPAIPTGYGGGLYNAAGATALIAASGIHDNREPSVGTISKGGGIYNDGLLGIFNTTIANNEMPYEGGGIYNTSHGEVHINASTIAKNQSQYGGGIYNASGTVNLKNTLMSWNIGWQGGYDCEGTVVSEGYNFIRDLTSKMGGTPFQVCFIGGDSTGNIIGTENNPLMSAIGYYGGETKTYIPMTGSPLIDAGNPATPGSGGNACPATDQRDVSRPQADHCDIGASEATPQFTVTKNVDEVFTYPGQLITFTITVSNIGGLDSLDTTILDDLPAALNFQGPVTLMPEHPEATVATSAGALPELVTNLILSSGESVEISLPVTTTETYPGGEIITNTARARSPIPQSEGSGYRNIRTGWRLSLPLISR